LPHIGRSTIKEDDCGKTQHQTLGLKKDWRSLEQMAEANQAVRVK